MAGPGAIPPPATIGSGTISTGPSFLETQRVEEAKRFNEKLRTLGPEERLAQFGGATARRPNVMLRQNRVDPTLLQSRPEDEEILLNKIRSPRDPALERIAQGIQADQDLQQSISTQAETQETGPYSGDLGGYSLEPAPEPPPEKAPIADPERDRMVANLMRDNKKLTLEQAEFAVDSLYSATQAGGGSGGSGSGGFSGLKAELLQSERGAFSVPGEDGNTTAQQITKLYNNFSAASSDLKGEGKIYSDSLKALRTGERNFFHASAEKQYNVQIAQSELDTKKLAAAKSAEKHHKKLRVHYFGPDEGDAQDPNAPASKGLFYKMQDVIDSQVANLQKTSNLGRHLFDFSSDDEDSFLGVNWKKTALAVAGVVAMGGQIGLSIGVKGLPNFIGPLLAKAIDADISSQKAAASESRLKAAGIGNLFDSLMNGYGSAVKAINHAKVGGYQVALALLNQAKSMPLTKDAAEAIRWLEQSMQMEVSKAAMDTKKVIMDATKDEVAMAVDSEMKAQQYQNLETQEDATKINSLVALSNHNATKAGNPVTLTTLQVKKVDSGLDAINAIRNIKRQATDLFALELGPIDQIVYNTIGEFRKKFSDDNDVIQQLDHIIRQGKDLAYAIASARDPKISNADFENQLMILGTPETESLFSYITSLYNTEYAVKEATLSRLSAVHGTASWDAYDDRTRLAFGQDADVVMSNFIQSAMEREKASQASPGTASTAVQQNAAHQRLNVGIIPVRSDKYPDLDTILFKPFLGSPLTNKAPLGRISVTKDTPAQRRQDFSAMVSPVIGGIVVTSPQGDRNTGIPGASTNHGGTDIRAGLGDKILSITDGTVYKVVTGNTGFGNYIVIQDLHGNLHTYAHGSDVSFLAKGDSVTAGDRIMLAGKSGTADEEHLHYEVENSRGRPLPSIAFLGSTWVTKEEKAAKDKAKAKAAR